jgi:hypothetical protein
MDAMEARAGAGVAWFRLNHTVIDAAGPPSSVLGPRHRASVPERGGRLQPEFDRPAVQEAPGRVGGVRAETRWRPETGLGTGSGVLLDRHGEIGQVSMSVILVPFPKAEPPQRPEVAARPAAVRA